MASILQTKQYELLARYWKDRLTRAKSVDELHYSHVVYEYTMFTQFLYETQDNFRVSYFDEAVGYERTE